MRTVKMKNEGGDCWIKESCWKRQNVSWRVGWGMGMIVKHLAHSTIIYNWHFVSFLLQHSVILGNSIVDSHIEHLNNVFHHSSDLWNHLCFAILNDRASFLVDCLHVGHFTHRILLSEVQTLRLESSHFCFCHCVLES